MSEQTFADGEIESIRQELGAWYDGHRRDLPWREIDDPYKTWVAEMMLQQTQVATVVDYYRRWLERFPDVESVAEAEVDDVLELWEGLGYYRRARYLHRSARKIVEEYGGNLPDTADELEELIGVGPYTAGAIASIAFQESVPVVDGNVSRVLSRLRAIEGDPKSTDNKKLYWELAEALVDPDRPGDFNQAMMELGATVCVPSTPNCLLCPIRQQCRGFQEGEPAAYPDTASRATPKPMSVAACLAVRRGPERTEVLVSKRPADGLLGGLWEFPTLEVEADSPAAETRRAIERFLVDDLGYAILEAYRDRRLGSFTHRFFGRVVETDDRVEGPSAQEVEAAGGGWWPVDQLDELAMSAAMRRAEQFLEPLVDAEAQQ